MSTHLIQRKFRQIMVLFGFVPSHSSWLEDYFTQISRVKAGGQIWRVNIHLITLIFVFTSILLSYKVINFDQQIVNVLFPIVYHGRLTRDVYCQLLGMYLMTFVFYYVSFFQFHHKSFVNLLGRILFTTNANDFFLLGRKTITVFAIYRNRVTGIMNTSRVIMVVASGNVSVNIRNVFKFNFYLLSHLLFILSSFDA